MPLEDGLGLRRDQVALVLELADAPFLTDCNASLLGACRAWPPDAQVKFTRLWAGRLADPRDFDVLADALVANFENLPSVVRAFFEDEIRAMACPATARIVGALQKSAGPGTVEFCKRVRDAWLAVRAAPDRGADPARGDPTAL